MFRRKEIGKQVRGVKKLRFDGYVAKNERRYSGAVHTVARSRSDKGELRVRVLDATASYGFSFLSAQEVETLGNSLGYTTENRNFHNVSLGQGQEAVAEAAIEKGSQHGHWVMLQVRSLVSIAADGERIYVYLVSMIRVEYTFGEKLVTDTG